MTVVPVMSGRLSGRLVFRSWWTRCPLGACFTVSSSAPRDAVVMIVVVYFTANSSQLSDSTVQIFLPAAYVVAGR